MKKINWDKVPPKEISLIDLESAKEKDFPDTYAGQAWKACWLMYHKGYKVDKKEFLKQDGWGSFPYLKDLDLTGFMVGWACNVLRHMLKESPVADGATLIIGGGDNQPVGVPAGNAEKALDKTLQGKSYRGDKMFLCESCSKKSSISGQMFRRYKCSICKKAKLHPNTGVPKVCLSCAEEKNICQRCEKLIK